MAKRSRRSTSRPLFDVASEESGPDVPPPGGPDGTAVALHEAAQARYLNYALSVITSRALPDVRDGLKPVQRRILYTMWQQRLTAEAKHRKCAKVVGDVMGSYHPHGDAAIYETLVRMAQPFSLRYPLVDGSGNFGSLDGDPAAAMRYTECRLAPISDELLTEIGQDTVPYRSNYDGTKFEPVMLPARLPNLLINGATGIAVGMATNIPPHNLHEVCTALLKLLQHEDMSSVALCRYIKGPDFPTGGQILNSDEELKAIYKTGSGTIRLRSTWERAGESRTGLTVHVTSVPYGVNKAQLVERIADLIVGRKIPPLLDVKDISTDDVRIELTLKREADPPLVMAYLFKHTALQTTFPVNLTCLVPTENPEVGRPERLDLRQMLWHFLHFRLDVVTRRLEHELQVLQKRIHILQGFAKIFDALDQVLKLIRRSEGKADAAAELMTRFGLDEVQADAVLELKLYRLAKLEIQVIRDELGAKRRRAREIQRLLDDERGRWKVVRDEIETVRKSYGDVRSDPRRTVVEPEAEVVFTEDDFIVDEDGVVLLSRDGWIKRQKEVRDLSTTRLREGDAVLSVLSGSTRATVVFFTNFGTAYTSRLADVPASTGYGEPIQRLFKFRDGERVVGALSLDPRVIGQIVPRRAGQEPPVHAVAVSSDGYSLRFSLEPFLEASTRAGRRYARLASGAEVVGVERLAGGEVLIAATRQARAMLCRAREVNFLSGSGRGVILIKLAANRDQVLGFVASTGDRDLLTVETSRGASQNISTAKYEVTGRGGKGRELLQRGEFVRILPKGLDAPLPLDPG